MDKSSEILPSNLHQQLRQAFVSEIIGERQAFYKDFILDITDYGAEANRFLDDEYYHSQLGNLMPLAMATVLQTHLIIFRADSDCDTPLYVTPPTDPYDRTIYLVYDKDVDTMTQQFHMLLATRNPKVIL